MQPTRTGASRPPRSLPWTVVTLRHAMTIAFGAAIFILFSFLVARWLTAENRERTVVTDLLRAQAGGDADSMIALIDGCAQKPACTADARRNARTLSRPGDVRVLRIDSSTAHALLAEEGRRAWPGTSAARACRSCSASRWSAAACRSSAARSSSRASARRSRGTPHADPRGIALLVAVTAALAAAPAAHAQTPPVPAPPAAGPPASSIVSTPSSKTLYRDGPSGRFLVDGTWLFRPDPAFNGDGRGWQRSASTGGVDGDDGAERLERDR